MALVWILIGAALVVAMSVFHAHNPTAVDVSLYGYPVYGVPMWMLVGVPALAGLLLGLLLDVPARLRHTLHERRAAKGLRDREKTIGSLEQRIAELERDLAVAKKPAPPVAIEEVREVPAGTHAFDRTDEVSTRRAA